MRAGFVIGLAMSVLAGAAPAAAQTAPTYPARPIHVIIAIAPGSIADLTVRALGAEVGAELGQPWVIENRPGGNQIPAMDACARAAPDGYTLCAVSATGLSFNPNLMASMPYDAGRDFKPVVKLMNVVEGVIVSNAVPVGTIAELQAYPPAKQGKLNFGTLGPNSATDITRMWITERLGLDIPGVPYKGGIEIIKALFANEVQVSWIGLGNMTGNMADGKAKVIAVHSAKRSPLLPDVPTLDEQGVTQSPISAWWGIAAPAATPDAIVERLNAAIRRVLAGPKMSDFLTHNYLEDASGTPAEFASFLASERAAIGTLVRKYNIPKQ
jgi:tripartite-type tricarboxylate transporter receptor subunit TctC